MNAIVKEIERLGTAISMIEFAEHLSREDYQKEREYRDRISELVKKLGNYKGVAVRFSHKDTKHYSSNYSYLTGHPSLCFSSSPTLFENEEEAREYLNNAEIGDASEYNIEFITVSYQDKLPSSTKPIEKEPEPIILGEWFKSEYIDPDTNATLYKCSNCSVLSATTSCTCGFCGAKMTYKGENQ